MLKYWQQFVFAVKFMTRIPLPFEVDYTEELPAKSMAYYPLVGAIIGIILICVNIIMSLLFPYSVVNIIILITLIYLTGGLHLDGFMDSIDGLFSGRKRDKILEIMHDSRTGAFGVIGVVLLLLLKYILLLELSGASRNSVIFIMPVISRWLLVYVAYKYPLATGSKLGRGFSNFISIKQPIIASCWLLVLIIIVNIIGVFSLYQILVIFALCWLFTLIIAFKVKKKLNGLTGDIYGAINEMVEVMVLLVFLAIMR